MKTTTSFQEYTNLPVQEIAKADSGAVAIIVHTPMGKRMFDYVYTSSGFFTGDRNVEQPASYIIKNLIKLENESKQYLLDEWKKTLIYVLLK